MQVSCAMFLSGLFEPERNITRAEFVAVMDPDTVLAAFGDSGEITDWARKK